MSTTNDETTIRAGVAISIADMHGPDGRAFDDFFPLWIESGRHSTNVYLTRAQLHALRLRLDEVDDTAPQS